MMDGWSGGWNWGHDGRQPRRSGTRVVASIQARFIQSFHAGLISTGSLEAPR